MEMGIRNTIGGIALRLEIEWDYFWNFLEF